MTKQEIMARAECLFEGMADFALEIPPHLQSRYVGIVRAMASLLGHAAGRAECGDFVAKLPAGLREKQFSISEAESPPPGIVQFPRAGQS